MPGVFGVLLLVAAITGSGPLRQADRARKAHVTVPQTLQPGQLITVRVTGFPAGSRVRVQFGLDLRPPANCCATTLIPRPGKPALALGSDGARTLRVRMPRRYARCTSVSCPDPELTFWKSGERVYVFVATNRFGSGRPAEAFARAIAHIR